MSVGSWGLWRLWDYIALLQAPKEDVSDQRPNHLYWLNADKNISRLCTSYNAPVFNGQIQSTLVVISGFLVVSVLNIVAQGLPLSRRTLPGFKDQFFFY